MISFIIPCFNRSKAIFRVIESFLWQTEDLEYEIILVDNNSTHDNLLYIYEHYFERVPLYLIHQPKLKTTYSLCKARNLGINIARYPWIVTLDSDCILNPNYFRACKRFIYSEKLMMITGERKFINPSHLSNMTPNILEALPQVQSKSNYGLSFDRRLLFIQDLNTQPQPWAYMHGGNCLFRKKEALKINGYDERYDGCWGYEDIAFAYILKQAHPEMSMEFDPNLYVYHQEDEAYSEIDEHRWDKKDNPNWKRISGLIPNYAAFKKNEYRILKEHLKEEEK